jgi:hypothetical protein
MSLAEWAESQGIARVTAYSWFRDGKLPVKARKVGGLILIADDAADADAAAGLPEQGVMSSDCHRGRCGRPPLPADPRSASHRLT